MTEAPNKKMDNTSGWLWMLGVASETSAGMTPPAAKPRFQHRPVPVARNAVGKRSFRKINNGA